jgi:hypothetical protein
MRVRLCQAIENEQVLQLMVKLVIYQSEKNFDLHYSQLSFYTFRFCFFRQNLELKAKPLQQK